MIYEIEQKINSSKDYWDFKKHNDSKRDFVHNMFSYPAMMVPKMQRELLNIVIDNVNNSSDSTKLIRSILDPFVGSGTILVEGMLRGLNVTGIDINPLAILICKVKTTPLNLDDLNNKISLLQQRIRLVYLERAITDFPKIEKWFKYDVILQLDQIKYAIKSERSIEIRRFFWVSFCQTVRSVSNSRSVTYKLHIKDKRDIDEFNVNVIELFLRILHENFTQYSMFINELVSRNLIQQDEMKYRGEVNIIYGDTKEVLENELSNNTYDLLFTSPPYGDNHTTVTYGQYSILQLRWIDIDDIGIDINNRVLMTNSEIDRQSLGGRIGKTYVLENCQDVLESSETLKQQVEIIKTTDEEKTYKLLSFYSDLEKCIASISTVMKPCSFLIWTVGIRKVAYNDIKMNEILEEIAREYNLNLVYDFERGIHKKRMPDMNAYKGEKDKLINTMKKEIVMILKKE